MQRIDDEDPELLPLKPAQCVLLLPDTFIAMDTGRLWLDNVYVKLTRRVRVLPSLQRVPSFITLGRRESNREFSDYEDDQRLHPLTRTEIHVTNVTFQGDGVASAHGVLAAGTGKHTNVFIIGVLGTRARFRVL